MKKLLFVIAVSVLLISCGEKKDKENTTIETVTVIENISTQTEEVLSLEENTVEKPEVIVVEKEIELPLVSGIDYEDILNGKIEPLTEKVRAHFNENDIFNSFPDLYVLGFSIDGKIAWIEKVFNEGAGFESLVFTIQNIVTDENVYSIKTNSEEINGSLETFVNLKKKEILSALQKYKINISDVTFKSFPSTIGDAKFNVEITDYENDSEYFMEGSSVKYKCEATKEGVGKKTLYSKEDHYIYNAYVCGYLKSPYENRIVVIVAEECIGFEGKDIRFVFTGCDLTKGYK